MEIIVFLSIVIAVGAVRKERQLQILQTLDLCDGEKHSERCRLSWHSYTESHWISFLQG